MPFNRPTLSQLQAQAAADIATAVPNADALLRFSNLGIMGKVQAALANGLYGYLDDIAQQSVPFTATGEALYAWGALKGVILKGATAAGALENNPIEVTFPNSANGTALPTNWPLVRSDGTPYVTTGAGEVAGGSVTAPCMATGTGSVTTCAVGQVMNLATAIAGISSTGAVSTAGSAGSDVEDDDDFRNRMLDAYQDPPMGGAISDYLVWALEVPGVTRAWVVPLEGGAGTVSVYVMLDVSEAVFGGFPQGSNGGAANETRTAPATGDQLTVANFIYPLRPVTALVSVKAPAPNTLNFTINGIASAGAATKAAISAAIAAVLLMNAAVGGAVDGNGDVLPGVDLSFIESAIAAIAGTQGFVITAITCSAGAVTPGTVGNITSNAGCLAVLGAVTYT
jgi:uncharacterized phage protein gp47/JayE